MKNIFLFIICFLSFTTSAQSWEWFKPTGYTDLNYEDAIIKRTVNGNLIITYSTPVNYPKNTEMIFCSETGDTLWKKYFKNLLINDFYVDGNENIYFAGNFIDTISINGITHISQGNTDGIVGMFDNTGNLLNEKVFGTPQSEIVNSLTLHGNQIFITGTFRDTFSIDGIMITGNGNADTYVARFDLSLNATNGFQTVTTSSFGYSAGLVVNVGLDSSLYLLGIGDEAFVDFGDTSIYVGEGCNFLAKFSNDLQFQWVKNIGSYGNPFQKYLLIDSDKNLILSYRTWGGSGAIPHIFVNKYTPDGNLIWSQGAPITYSGFIDIDTDDNIWAAGFYDNYYYPPLRMSVVKLSTTGAQTTVILDSINIFDVKGFTVKAENDFYILTNCVSDSLNGFSCSGSSRLIGHYGQGLITSVIADNESDQFQIYPNPSSGKFTIQIKDKSSETKICIYDVLGNCVLNKLSVKNGNQEIDLSNQPKGIYFIEIVSDGEKAVKKIVLN